MCLLEAHINLSSIVLLISSDLWVLSSADCAVLSIVPRDEKNHQARMVPPPPFLTDSDGRWGWLHDGTWPNDSPTLHACPFRTYPLAYSRFMHEYRQYHRQNGINNGGNRAQGTSCFFQEPKTKCRSTLCPHHSILIVEPSFVSFTFIYFIFPFLFYPFHHIQPCRQSSPRSSNCWDKWPNLSHRGSLPSPPP